VCALIDWPCMILPESSRLLGYATLRCDAVRDESGRSNGNERYSSEHQSHQSKAISVGKVELDARDYVQQ
jgi:hypothetical protein